LSAPNRPDSGRGNTADPSLEDPLVVKIASTQEELEMVYRFRYQVCVEELRRCPQGADHRNKRLKQPLDDHGVNFFAHDGTKIRGVIRGNVGIDGSFGPYAVFYGVDSPEFGHPYKTSISTGLIVDADGRRGMIGARLVVASYAYGLQRNIRWNFMDCIPPLTPYFLKLGYVEHLPEASHPEYQFPVKRMMLDLDDEKHLESVQSPFLRACREHKARGQRAETTTHDLPIRIEGTP
jgi:hypothetical protein